MQRKQVFIGISVLVLAVVAGTTASYFRTSLLGQAGGSGVQFAAKVDYTARTKPRNMAIGDLNGDGKDDIAVTNEQDCMCFSIFLNNGNGTLANKVDFNLAREPGDIVIGDLNGDGKADIAVTNYLPNNQINSSKISVFLNNGNATFAPKVDYPAPRYPRQLVLGDIDGDGSPDLAAISIYVPQSSYTIGVFRNNGNGTFASAVNYTASINPTDIAIADLNADGKLDLATSNDNPGTASVHLNNGNGAFPNKVEYATGPDPFALAIGDLNGDGNPDMAVTNRTANTVSVLRNNGNGTFAAKVDYATGSDPRGLAMGDLNADGKNDLATANYFGNSTSVLVNNGNGTFAAKVDFATGFKPIGIAIADLKGNGDGRDLTTANYDVNTVSVLLNLDFCGNGVVQGSEQCDDGNTVNTDACTNACRLAVCGDGAVQTGVEQCDDGNTVNTDGCSNICRTPGCGDGAIQSPEQCDDGNTVNTDSCTNACTNPRCGDSIVQAGEQCDDGNQTNTDACLNACTNAVCGDGVVRTGVEQCDDGNQTNTDACLNACTTARCGDGVVQTGMEQCDDGNQVNTDACTNACTPGNPPSSASSSLSSSRSSSSSGGGGGGACTKTVLGTCENVTVMDSALGADGLPIVVYAEDDFEQGRNSVSVTKCGNATCTAGNVTTNIDSLGGLSTQRVEKVNIAIPPDGLPVVVYLNKADRTLRVIKCGNAACSAVSAATTADASVGTSYAALALSANGLPVIAYHPANDNLVNKIKVLLCGNATCTAGNVIKTLSASNNQLARNFALAVPPDNKPIVIFHPNNATILYMLRCSSSDCQSASENIVINYSEGIREMIIKMGSDGFPRIAFQSVGPVVFLKCGTVTCNGGNNGLGKLTEFEYSQWSSLHSLIIPADGLPVVGFTSGPDPFSTADALKVIKCGKTDCSAGNTFHLYHSVPDEEEIVASLVLGADGFPFTFFWPFNSGDDTADMQAVKCGNVTCSNQCSNQNNATPNACTVSPPAQVSSSSSAASSLSSSSRSSSVSSRSSSSQASNVCGDGIVQPPEECDAGPAVRNEVQEMDYNGNIRVNWKVNFKGFTTVAIPPESTVEFVKDAFEDLASIGAGNILVQKICDIECDFHRYRVTFINALGGINQPEFTHVQGPVTTFRTITQGGPVPPSTTCSGTCTLIRSSSRSSTSRSSSVSFTSSSRSSIASGASSAGNPPPSSSSAVSQRSNSSRSLFLFRLPSSSSRSAITIAQASSRSSVLIAQASSSKKASSSSKIIPLPVGSAPGFIPQPIAASSAPREIPPPASSEAPPIIVLEPPPVQGGQGGDTGSPGIPPTAIGLPPDPGAAPGGTAPDPEQVLGLFVDLGLERTAAPAAANVPAAAPTATQICGDGLREGSEWCDDGNNTPEDGCSETCRLEGEGQQGALAANDVLALTPQEQAGQDSLDPYRLAADLLAPQQGDGGYAGSLPRPPQTTDSGPAAVAVMAGGAAAGFSWMRRRRKQ